LPLIRLFDDEFTIERPEGYRLDGRNGMAQISRDPLDLVAQCLSEHHHPDGFVRCCGTLFAPMQDRDQPGSGFPHKLGNAAPIRPNQLGNMTNTILTSRDAPA